MKAKHTSIVLLLILSSTLLFTSCGNDLSRSKAEKIIREEKGFPIIKFATLELRHIDNGYGMPEFCSKLQEKGLIKVNKEVGVQNQNTGSLETIYTISLTDLGKKYEIKPEQYNKDMKDQEQARKAYTYYSPYVFVKEYEFDFDKIGGLQKTSEFEIIANYSTKIVNQSPFFDVLNEESIKFGGGAKPYVAEKVFRKYDDGWK